MGELARAVEALARSNPIALVACVMIVCGTLIVFARDVKVILIGLFDKAKTVRVEKGSVELEFHEAKSTG